MRKTYVLLFLALFVAAGSMMFIGGVQQAHALCPDGSRPCDSTTFCSNFTQVTVPANASPVTGLCSQNACPASQCMDKEITIGFTCNAGYTLSNGQCVATSSQTWAKAYVSANPGTAPSTISWGGSCAHGCDTLEQPNCSTGCGAGTYTYTVRDRVTNGAIASDSATVTAASTSTNYYYCSGTTCINAGTSCPAGKSCSTSASCGNGCSSTPPSSGYGYVCVNGQCVEKAMGYYPNYESCESNCNTSASPPPPPTYGCDSNGMCTNKSFFGGPYGQDSTCKNQCTPGYGPTFVIVPPSANVPIGGWAQFRGLYDPDGPSGPQPEQDVTCGTVGAMVPCEFAFRLRNKNPSWGSSNDYVATSFGGGLYLGGLNGTATITASFYNLNADAVLSVGGSNPTTSTSPFAVAASLRVNGSHDLTGANRIVVPYGQSATNLNITWQTINAHGCNATNSGGLKGWMQNVLPINIFKVYNSGSAISKVTQTGTYTFTISCH